MREEERESIIVEIIEILTASGEVHKPDVLSRVQLADTAESNLIFWAAIERLRAETGIDFGPLHRRPLWYGRKSPAQTIERGRRQVRAGKLKVRRAVVKFEGASMRATDPGDKERAQRAAARAEMYAQIPEKKWA